MDRIQRIAVLGSTGSIGVSSLEVVQAAPHRLQILGLTAHRRWQQLAEQARIVKPRWVVLADASAQQEIPVGLFPAGVEVLFGPEAIERVARHPDIDIVVSGIVGAAGLRGTWAALEAGKTVAFANKETLVLGGSLVMDLARKSGARLLPVDSEHSAIFQAALSGRKQEIRRIILTASGGPFRTWSSEQMKSVTPAQALAHPTWDMGRKISIDSATMMNKALEIIEARWLFDLPVSQIEVVVHPQSIVHSLVEFCDGSTIAQMSPPDMKLPIQYALTYPERTVGLGPKMDFQKSFALEFSPPDLDRFPALGLGYEAARHGGTCGAVLNAANEVAVERFLAGSLSFCEIPRLCAAVMAAHHFDATPNLDELLKLDQWAREEALRWKSLSR